MSSSQNRWTAAISLALVMGALLACKKKKEAEPEAAPTAAATPLAPATTAATASAAPAAPAEPPGPKLGDVKRYPEKEVKEDEAAVKILENDVKVFNEADSATPAVATLPKDLVVVRLASLEKEAFMLVDFPSGIGQFAPGWVEKKFVESKGQQVDRDKVLAQEKTASIQPTTKPSSSAAATAGTKASASAAPKSAAASPEASASAAVAAIAKSAAPLLSALPKIDPKTGAVAPAGTTEKKKKKKTEKK